MRQSLIYCTLALLFVCGAFVGQTQANEAEKAVASVTDTLPQSVPAQPVVANKAVGTKAATPTQARTGYTRSQIRSMPLLSRPNRPGHFIGNTIRRRNAR